MKQNEINDRMTEIRTSDATMCITRTNIYISTPLLLQSEQTNLSLGLRLQQGRRQRLPAP